MSKQPWFIGPYVPPTAEQVRHDFREYLVQQIEELQNWKPPLSLPQNSLERLRFLRGPCRSGMSLSSFETPTVVGDSVTSIQFDEASS